MAEIIKKIKSRSASKERKKTQAMETQDMEVVTSPPLPPGPPEIGISPPSRGAEALPPVMEPLPSAPKIEHHYTELFAKNPTEGDNGEDDNGEDDHGEDDDGEMEIWCQWCLTAIDEETADKHNCIRAQSRGLNLGPSMPDETAVRKFKTTPKGNPFLHQNTTTSFSINPADNTVFYEPSH